MLVGVLVLQVVVAGLVLALLIRSRAADSGAVSKGIAQVRAATDEAEAAELAEGLVERHSGSLEAFEELWCQLRPLADEGDPSLRREIVARLERHAAELYARCPLEDLARARALREEVDDLVARLISEGEAAARVRLAAQVDALVEAVERCSSDATWDEETMRELESLDGALDKRTLPRFPELQAAYDEASKRLVAQLNAKDVGESVRQYNLRAVDMAEQAWAQFQKGKGIISDDIEVDPLVRLLGGWDSQHLLPSTNTYISSVYAEVFQRLKPEQRLDLTKKMITAPRVEMEGAGGTR